MGIYCLRAGHVHCDTSVVSIIAIARDRRILPGTDLGFSLPRLK